MKRSYTDKVILDRGCINMTSLCVFDNGGEINFREDGTSVNNTLSNHFDVLFIRGNGS